MLPEGLRRQPKARSPASLRQGASQTFFQQIYVFTHGGGILLREAARHLDENRHCDSGTSAWLALLLNRQQHVDLFAHSTRRAPLGQPGGTFPPPARVVEVFVAQNSDRSRPSRPVQIGLKPNSSRTTHSMTSSARAKHRRHVKAESLRSLEVADALELADTRVQPISSLPVTSRPIVVI